MAQVNPTASVEEDAISGANDGTKQTTDVTVNGSSNQTPPDLASDESPHEPSKPPSLWHRIQPYIWDSPDKPPHEKHFLLKLDIFLLTYTTLAYFCKNLDYTNLGQAYISGMREALGMYGSELTYAGNMFAAGYALSQLPAVMVMGRWRPSYVIPTLEMMWSVITFCTAAAKTVPQLYAMRFLLGLYLISSWYTKEERGKRVTIFYASGGIAGMFSGYLQAAAYTNLSGRLGHSGWQWLFIICGVISLPVSIMGYFFLPDFPENTHAFYLSKADAELARQRLLDVGYNPMAVGTTVTWNRKKILKIFKSWQFYLLALGFCFVQGAFPGYHQPAFALWLKYEGYSVVQANVWPTGQFAIGVVVAVVAGMLSDSPWLEGRRWQAITVMQGTTIFACVVLAVWNVPAGLKFAAFYLAYSGAGVMSITYSWFPELMPHDHEMRGFVTAVTSLTQYLNGIWFDSAFWRTGDAPEFHKGWIATSTFGVAVVLNSLLMRFLELRNAKRRESRDMEVNQQ